MSSIVYLWFAEPTSLRPVNTAGKFSLTQTRKSARSYALTPSAQSDTLMLDRTETLLGNLTPNPQSKPQQPTTESWMNFLPRQCSRRWQASGLLGLRDEDNIGALIPRVVFGGILYCNCRTEPAKQYRYLFRPAYCMSVHCCFGCRSYGSGDYRGCVKTGLDTRLLTLSSRNAKT